jgi:hypothetical protein
VHFSLQIINAVRRVQGPYFKAANEAAVHAACSAVGLQCDGFRAVKMADVDCGRLLGAAEVSVLVDPSHPTCDEGISSGES